MDHEKLKLAAGPGAKEVRPSCPQNPTWTEWCPEPVFLTPALAGY